MTHLDAEGNGDAAVAPLLLASGGLGQWRAWGQQAWAATGWGDGGWGGGVRWIRGRGPRAVSCGALARDDFGAGRIGRQ